MYLRLHDEKDNTFNFCWANQPKANSKSYYLTQFKALYKGSRYSWKGVINL